MLFDERDAVRARHGPPAEIVATTAPGLLRNETWAYPRPGESALLFHFVALPGSEDFTLVTDPLFAVATAGGVDPEASRRAVQQLFGDRAGLDPRFGSTARRLKSALATADGDRRAEPSALPGLLRAAYADRVAEALNGETYRAAFDAPLELRHALLNFRSATGRTELTVLLAARAASGAETAEPVLRVSIVLLDGERGVATRVDTVARPTRRGAPEGWACAHVTVPVMPGDHTLCRILVEDTASGAGRIRCEPIRLRNFGGGDLYASDVVLARADPLGAWRRGDLALDPALPCRVRRGDRVPVYYELYNLRPGLRYRTRIRVVPAEPERRRTLASLFRRRREHVELRFDDVAAPDGEGAVRQLRPLAAELKPGWYTIRVTVEDAWRRRASSRLSGLEVVED